MSSINDINIKGKSLELKKIEITFIALIFLVLIGFLGYYIYGNTVRNDYVHYSNCFKPIAPYSVQANVEATTILYQCGSDGKQRCQARADNLEQAIQFCETYANVCDIFSYDPSKKKVLIHPNNTGYASLTKTDNNVYYRNTGVTYQNNAADSVDVQATPTSTVKNVNTTTKTFDLLSYFNQSQQITTQTQ